MEIPRSVKISNPTRKTLKIKKRVKSFIREKELCGLSIFFPPFLFSGWLRGRVPVCKRKKDINCINNTEC